MKSKINILKLFLIVCFCCPTAVFAVSYNNITPKLVNVCAIVQSGAIVNDGNTNPSNFNLVIIGLLVVILILVGIAMFAPKK